MRLSLIAFACLLLVASATMSFAEDKCEIYEDVGDSLTLGHVAIGSDLSGRPGASEVLRKCRADKGRGSSDCSYTDEDGVAYTFAETDGALEVIHAEVRNLPLYRGHLIANVEANDSLDTVRRKLRSLPKNFPQWKLIDDARLISNDCIKGSNGRIWGYELDFDHMGGLTSIATWVDMGMDGEGYFEPDGEGVPFDLGR
jgi:hypothetical protein